MPKVARFNAFLRDRPEAFGDLTMWHWQDDQRSADYAVQPIPSEMIRNGVFVFLGNRQPISTVDPRAALRTIDRLMPLYAFVEANEVAPDDLSATASAIDDIGETLNLEGGREIDGGRWITATNRARTLDIFLRHREIQRRLKAKLAADGIRDTIFEVPIGVRSIDLVARHASELWFYEVKTAPTVRGCLREAIGQLLEYALWPGATRPDRLIVVGEPSLDASSRAYLATLNETFPIPISYEQLRLE